MRGRFGIERQHIKTRHEMFNGRQVLDATCRLFRAIVQLAERDTGDAELLGQ